MRMSSIIVRLKKKLRPTLHSHRHVACHSMYNIIFSQCDQKEEKDKADVDLVFNNSEEKLCRAKFKNRSERINCPIFHKNEILQLMKRCS